MDKIRGRGPAVTAFKLNHKVIRFHARTVAARMAERGVRQKNGRTGFESFTVKGDFGAGSKQANLFGGALTENITQRMARDILAIIRLEGAGLPVVFHAHDEVIIEIDDDGSKEEAKAEAERIMCKASAWAQGLPLAVEGSFESSYTK
jgi:hypothetical protein